MDNAKTKIEEIIIVFELYVNILQNRYIIYKLYVGIRHL